MKKNYALFSVLTLACSLSFAQEKVNRKILESERQALPVTKPLTTNSELFSKSNQTAKAIGDTLFYEEFDGGLNGWTPVNNSAGTNIWEWNTVYRGGAATSNLTAIKSTTGSNGFLSLPSDFFNTPRPAGGPVPMDTYVESPLITLSSSTNSVFVSYQQYLAYCCSSANRLVLEVSTDNFVTSTEFDATDGLPTNTLNTSNAVGGAVNVINISCALQGSSSFRMRFYSEGNAFYFWMIDDVAVIEGAHNDLELQDPYMEFNEANYDYYPFYGQTPYELFPPLPFFGRVKNNGDNTATNVEMNVSVDHIAGTSGGSGNGNIYTTSETVGPTGDILGAYLLPCDTLTPVLTPNPRFVPLVTGDFEVNWFVSSDSVDQNPGNEVATQFFSTSDTIFARDDNTFSNGTGPGSYVSSGTGQPGGTTVGDRFATMYIVERSPRVTKLQTRPTSITFRVSNDSSNIGVEITPKIWKYNEDSLFVGGSFSVNRAIGPEVAGSFFPYTVTAIDTFLTLPLNTGTAVMNGFDSSQYIVGWEVTNLPNGTNFEVLNDASSAALQSSVTSFVYLGHAPSEGWGWVSVNPGIRLNMGYLPINTGVAKPVGSSIEFAVNPNPNKGDFNLNISTISNTSFNLNIRNTLGQSVYTEVINVNGKMTKQLDLTSFEKGVYFVSLENENEKLVKRVVIQ